MPSALVFLLALLTITSASRTAYLTKEGSIYKLVDVGPNDQIPDDHLAKAIFDNQVNATGWAIIEVDTNVNADDEEQAYAAGYLEGAMSAELIWMHWVNTMESVCDDQEDLCDQVKKMFEDSNKFFDDMIDQHATTNPYWYQVKLLIKQVKGLGDGYNISIGNLGRTLTWKEIYMLNMQGDLADLIAKVKNEGVSPTDGHCSALIKLLPDGSDLLTAHVSWNGYESMLRMLKKYGLKYKTLPNSKDIIKGHTMSFSSSPGLIQSLDDFYVISSGLVTLETTLGNSNLDMWKFVDISMQLGHFIRTMVANRMADTGEEWANIAAMYNSGTYNNQWMVVDYKRFKPGSLNQEAGLLWIMEQIPGLVEMDDVTNQLTNQTYWPSYNTAFFPTTYVLSGSQARADNGGDWFTYDKTPRALMFKRDHGKVKNMDDMHKLMTYNDYLNDPLSICDCDPPQNAENAISARSDLNPINGTYPFPSLYHRSHGGIDAKITNTEMMKKYLFLAESGPTRNENKGVPPFQWSKSDYDKQLSHLGHPDLWTFDPIVHEWVW